MTDLSTTPWWAAARALRVWLGPATIAVALAFVGIGCGGAGSAPPREEVTEVFLAAEPPADVDPDAVLPAGGRGIADLFGARAEAVRVCEKLFGPKDGDSKVRLAVHLSVSHGDTAGISKIEAVGDELGRYRHWTGCLMGALRGAAFRDPITSNEVYLLDVERAGAEPPKALVGKPVLPEEPAAAEQNAPADGAGPAELVEPAP